MSSIYLHCMRGQRISPYRRSACTAGTSRMKGISDMTDKERFIAQVRDNFKNDQEIAEYGNDFALLLESLLDHCTVTIGKESYPDEIGKLRLLLLFSDAAPGGSLGDYCCSAVVNAVTGWDSCRGNCNPEYRIVLPPVGDCICKFEWFEKNVTEFALSPDEIMKEFWSFS